MDPVDAMLLVTFVILVAALFVLALAESSLLHVRRSAVAVEAAAGDRRAVGLLALLDDLPRVMNAVLLTVLLAQVSAATIAGALARSWIGGAGITVATAVVTIVLFVYGEAIPKTMAVGQPLRFARRLASPIRTLSTGLRPVVSILVKIADAQAPGSGIDAVSGVGEAELLHLAGDAALAGRIDESDAELIERSFAFGDLGVQHVFVPRSEVVSVADETRVDVALEAAITAGHRRLPVYAGDLDQIVGFVRLRDLVAAASVDPGERVVERLQPVLRVTRADPVVRLLRRMQHAACHLAVVVDGQGRTEGIVTIEDVVEELVGTIEEF